VRKTGNWETSHAHWESGGKPLLDVTGGKGEASRSASRRGEKGVTGGNVKWWGRATNEGDSEGAKRRKILCGLVPGHPPPPPQKKGTRTEGGENRKKRKGKFQKGLHAREGSIRTRKKEKTPKRHSR